MELLTARFGLRTLEACRQMLYMLEIVAALPENSAPTSTAIGGILTIHDTNRPNLIEQYHLGFIPGQKAGKYAALSQEKATRTVTENRTYPNKLFASNSMNPDENQFGGAVVIKDHVFAFSGMAAVADEVFSSMFGMWYMRITNDQFWSSHQTAASAEAPFDDLPYIVKTLYPRFEKEVLGKV